MIKQYGPTLIFFLCCMGFSWQGMAQAAAEAESLPEVPRATNVVVMIGDGMGLSQISAAMYQGKRKLALEEFPITGVMTTHSASERITDSAAGATAFACGIKTNNFMVGLSPDSLPCNNLFSQAKTRGLATGIVVTSTLVHATPAAFYAHQPLRGYYEAIASDLVAANLDLLIGGGLRYFNKRQSDSRNLVDEMISNGYEVLDFSHQPLNEINVSSVGKVVYFTATEDPPPRSNGRDYLPYAAAMALDYLQVHSREGFMLLVEGSQIDWAGHANDAQYLLDEALDFDLAIDRVLRYARRRGDTLVLVLADHETGGTAVQPGSAEGEVILAFTSGEHTSTMIPVFAYGPGAELFSGMYDNTDIYFKIRQALGWKDLEPENK